MTSGREEYQLAPFVDAVEIYCDAVRALADDLPSRQLASEGLNGLCGYLAEYVASPGFTSLVDETGGLREALGAIRYSVLIQGGGLPSPATPVTPTTARRLNRRSRGSGRGA